MSAPVKLTCHWRRQLYGDKKKIRKETWNDKGLKNVSKDRDSNFLVMFSSRKASKAIEKREGRPLMLVTIRGDTYNMLNMQHIIWNSKRWDYSDTPDGDHKKIKGPAHMIGLKVATTSEKPPTALTHNGPFNSFLDCASENNKGDNFQEHFLEKSWTWKRKIYYTVGFDLQALF